MADDYKALVGELTEAVEVNFGRPNDARKVMDGIVAKLGKAATAITSLTARAEKAEHDGVQDGMIIRGLAKRWGALCVEKAAEIARAETAERELSEALALLAAAQAEAERLRKVLRLSRDFVEDEFDTRNGAFSPGDPDYSYVEDAKHALAAIDAALAQGGHDDG